MMPLRRPGLETIALVVAAMASVLPLWCVRSPAMPDYPAHLATYYLIATGAKAPSSSRGPAATIPSC